MLMHIVHMIIHTIVHIMISGVATMNVCPKPSALLWLSFDANQKLMRVTSSRHQVYAHIRLSSTQVGTLNLFKSLQSLTYLYKPTYLVAALRQGHAAFICLSSYQY